MAGQDYSGMGDFVANMRAKQANQEQFLEGFRQRQEETNKRVLTSTAIIVAGVVGWNAYRKFRNAPRP
jgi:predicted negative regulator of RcsB-dependent stress response